MQILPSPKPDFPDPTQKPPLQMPGEDLETGRSGEIWGKMDLRAIWGDCFAIYLGVCRQPNPCLLTLDPHVHGGIGCGTVVESACANKRGARSFFISAVKSRLTNSAEPLNCDVPPRVRVRPINQFATDAKAGQWDNRLYSETGAAHCLAVQTVASVAHWCRGILQRIPTRSATASP
jgi:hypothetical protein